MNIVTQGEIANVIDHRRRAEDQVDQTQPKRHFSVYELQVEYENQFEKENTDSNFQWAPFTLIYQQAPKLVQEYFTLKAVNIESILNEEVEAREQFYKQKQGRRNWHGKNRNHQDGQPKDPAIQDPTPREYVDRSFDYLAKQTLFVTDKYQLGKSMNCQPTGEGKIKAKKKRLKRFLETEEAELNKKMNIKDKNEWSSAMPTFVNGWMRPGRHEQNVLTQQKLNKVTKFGEDIAMADDEARKKSPADSRITATSTLPQPDEDGLYTIQNPAVTFEELNLKDVRQERKEHEEQQRQAINQGGTKVDQDLFNYYPNTLTKEDRRKQSHFKTLNESDKQKKPASSDWMNELKNSKSGPKEQIDVWAPGKQSDQRGQVINLETSDDDAQVERDCNVMVVDEFIKKEKSGKSSSPLLVDDTEEEPNPYEHTTTQYERNQLYLRQTDGNQNDQNPWLQERLKQKKVIENELKQASDYQKIQQFYKNDQNFSEQKDGKKPTVSPFTEEPAPRNNSPSLQPKVAQPQDKQQLEVGKNQLQQIFKVGFRPPQTTPQGSSGETEVLLDCPQDHPNLVERNGTPWTNIPKMIHGMRVCEQTKQVMYLCSWEQDYLQYFYTPSWVLSQLLICSGGDQEIEKSQMNNYKLIAEFYHHFAVNSTLYEVKEPKEKPSATNSPVDKKQSQSNSPVDRKPEAPGPPKTIDRSRMMTKDDWRMRVGL